MRAIPSLLLDKIQQAYQTAHGNAEPHMDIIVQQSTQFLEQGLMLNPCTLWVDEELTAIDVAVSRQDKNQAPEELSMVYIVDGIAKLATLDATDNICRDWVYQRDLGPAVDCAIDYDGRWQRITGFDDEFYTATSRWALVTFGEPYIALVKPDGSLTIQQGEVVLTLAPDGVTRVSMIRGWKTITEHTNDQGIVCAYIRNGDVKYRNYAEQVDNTFVWEFEKSVDEFDTSVHPATHVSIFRTNDYRIGIFAEINGEMQWAMSRRNWSGMAIEDHHISVGLTDYTISVLPIVHSSYYHPENISVGLADYFIAQCTPVEVEIESITNPDEFTIIITFSHDITQARTGHQSAFSVRDSAATPATFTVNSTSAGTNANQLVLNMSNFMSASGDMTVTYDNGVTVGNLVPRLSCKNGLGDLCEFAIESFVESFTPVLIPPEGYSTDHISVGIVDYYLEVKAPDAPPVYTQRNGHDREFLSVGLVDYAIVVTKVGDNPL